MGTSDRSKIETIMLPKALLAILLPTLAQAHGNMLKPYTWFDIGGNIGISPGLQCKGVYPVGVGGSQQGACMWFNNDTSIPGPPTIKQNSPLRTYYDTINGYDVFQKMPWRAPGSAKIYSPCGIAGGNPYGCPAGSADQHECPGGGFSNGPDARNYSFDRIVVTEWKAGDVVEAAWGIIANHGGGYSYRLCKVPPGGRSEVTEECFQKMPLEFYGDEQYVQYGEGGQRFAFKANRTRNGTFPKGSQWTKNPIAPCKGIMGGFGDLKPGCPGGTQFPPPAPGLAGFGELSSAPGYPTFYFSIIDKLKVPKLEPGDYVLSFRWDCEQTTQVWTACSSIRINA